jgi:anthranilate/para-aminobenzoate synthase component I
MIRQGEGSWYIGVGSALTFDCVPEDEWQECQWKIAPFRRLFNLEISNDARSI